jgi:hypothetical protein
MNKNRVQNTSNKVQSSISHTPEGTNTVRIRLIGAERITSSEAHEASVVTIDLCTTPVARGGERVPEGSTGVSGILELCYCRYKPSGTSRD